ncbi:MAG: glycosyltransferase, partial [Stellaceae bacterium]
IHALSRRLPYRVKSWLRASAKFSPVRHEAIDDGAVSFAEIERHFFAGRQHCPAYSKCISSRNFDAAGTGTCQILVRGRYNDILTADEHYIPLEPDLANAREAIERFRDPAERARVAEAAYALVHDRHTYRHRLAELHRQLAVA